MLVWVVSSAVEHLALNEGVTGSIPVRPTMSWKEKVIIILSGLGVIVSSYLVLKTLDPSTVTCAIVTGCEEVLSSRYAKIGGFPIAGLGVIWYLVTLTLVWLVYGRRLLRKIVLIMWATIGLIFSAGLIYISSFEIGAYCIWCLTSSALVSLIFVISLTGRSA